MGKKKKTANKKPRKPAGSSSDSPHRQSIIVVDDSDGEEVQEQSEQSEPPSASVSAPPTPAQPDVQSKRIPPFLEAEEPSIGSPSAAVAPSETSSVISESPAIPTQEEEQALEAPLIPGPPREVEIDEEVTLPALPREANPEPENSEKSSPEPVAPEPVASEPVAPEPVLSEPASSEPVPPESAPEPEIGAPEPVTSIPEPVASEPLASEPEPVAAEPETVEAKSENAVHCEVVQETTPESVPEPDHETGVSSQSETETVGKEKTAKDHVTLFHLDTTPKIDFSQIEAVPVPTSNATPTQMEPDSPLVVAGGDVPRPIFAHLDSLFAEAAQLGKKLDEAEEVPPQDLSAYLNLARDILVQVRFMEKTHLKTESKSALRQGADAVQDNISMLKTQTDKNFVQALVMSMGVLMATVKHIGTPKFEVKFKEEPEIKVLSPLHEVTPPVKEPEAAELPHPAEPGPAPQGHETEEEAEESDEEVPESHPRQAYQLLSKEELIDKVIALSAANDALLGKLIIRDNPTPAGDSARLEEIEALKKELENQKMQVASLTRQKGAYENQVKTLQGALQILEEKDKTREKERKGLEAEISLLKLMVQKQTKTPTPTLAESHKPPSTEKLPVTPPQLVITPVTSEPEARASPSPLPTPVDLRSPQNSPGKRSYSLISDSPLPVAQESSPADSPPAESPQPEPSPLDSPVGEEDEDALMMKTLALIKKDPSLTLKSDSFDGSSDTSSFDESREKNLENLLKTPVITMTISDEDRPAFEKAAVIIQKRIRGVLARKLYKAEIVKSHIAKEILDTEESFVQQLRHLVLDYMTAFGKQQGKESPISQEQWSDIFAYVPGVLEYNSELVKLIRTRIKDRWHYQQKIGDVFIQASSKLANYTNYVNNYNRALTALHQCQKISAFQALCQEIYTKKSADSKIRLTLSDLLIIPIQRIPRYVLMLEQILKKTRRDHPDREDLETAIQRLKETAAEINKKKGESMKLQMVYELQQKMSNYPAQKLGDLATPDRIIVLEGELFERAPGGGYKERHVFLFNDMLLCTKFDAQQGFFKGNNNNITSEFKWAYFLNSHGPDAVLPVEEVQTKESTRSLYPMVFNWHTEKGMEKKILATLTEEDRQEWETTFRKLRDECVSRSGSTQDVRLVKKNTPTFFRHKTISERTKSTSSERGTGSPLVTERPKSVFSANHTASRSSF